MGFVEAWLQCRFWGTGLRFVLWGLRLGFGFRVWGVGVSVTLLASFQQAGDQVRGPARHAPNLQKIWGAELIMKWFVRFSYV